MQKGAANPWTFNQVLAAGIGVDSSKWWQPKRYWHGASLALFLTDEAGADAVDAAQVLAAMFPDKGAWDVKVPLGEHFGFDKSDPETDPSWGYLSMSNGGGMFYDVIGNFQYGVMMSDFGVSQDVALSASHVSSAGNPDPQDDAVVRLGYEFRGLHPDDFNSQDMYSFLTSSQTLAVLQDAQRYVPPSS